MSWLGKCLTVQSCITNDSLNFFFFFWKSAIGKCIMFNKMQMVWGFLEGAVII